MSDQNANDCHNEIPFPVESTIPLDSGPSLALSTGQDQSNPARRADAVKNRALLLETAQRLFDGLGVQAVSMSAIAEAAGVGKGTLYRHFENKTEVCEALLDKQQRDLQNQTFQRLGSGDSPAAKLRWFLAQAVGFVLNNEDLLTGGRPEVALLSHRAHIWWRQTIQALLRQVFAAPTHVDIDYLADVLYVMLDVRTLIFQHNARGYTPERIIAGLHAILDHFLA